MREKENVLEGEGKTSISQFLSISQFPGIPGLPPLPLRKKTHIRSH